MTMKRSAKQRAWAMLLALSLPCFSALADDAVKSTDAVMTGEQIVEALEPARTRSFTPRGLRRREASATDQSVNLNIPFELNSSTLQPQASEQLKQLEFALSSASLAGDRFIVAGHTDAKGSARYNKQLSLKRAEAVKRFLVAKGLSGDRLDTVGYGSERLLAPDRPEDPSNRRVEIRAIGGGTPAGSPPGAASGTSP
jgi:outer membrane protein OmpA-like peptidoglycan-associated protein